MSRDFRDLARDRSNKVVRLNWKWRTNERNSNGADYKVCSINLFETMNKEGLNLKIDFKVTFHLDKVADDHK